MAMVAIPDITSMIRGSVEFELIRTGLNRMEQDSTIAKNGEIDQ